MVLEAEQRVLLMVVLEAMLQAVHPEDTGITTPHVTVPAIVQDIVPIIVQDIVQDIVPITVVDIVVVLVMVTDLDMVMGLQEDILEVVQQ